MSILLVIEGRANISSAVFWSAERHDAQLPGPVRRQGGLIVVFGQNVGTAVCPPSRNLRRVFVPEPTVFAWTNWLVITAK